jgi:hypothetical protein
MRCGSAVWRQEYLVSPACVMSGGQGLQTDVLASVAADNGPSGIQGADAVFNPSGRRDVAATRLAKSVLDAGWSSKPAPLLMALDCR